MANELQGMAGAIPRHPLNETLYMLYRYMYMYGDAAQEFKTENKFSDLTGQTADHSVEAMSFQNWYECFTTG